MTMQRRHFELIAQTINEALTQPAGAFETTEYTEGYEAALKGIALRFARDLRETNPNFNRERFLKACGVEG